jgi:hypothetical protein
MNLCQSIVSTHYPDGRLYSLRLVRWELHTSYGHENDLFRNQAAQLKLDHNDLLIVIHRQFINFEKSSPASLAAHAICTTAARSNAKVFDAHPPNQWQLVVSHRPLLKISMTNHLYQISAMDTALVLLVGLWGANKLNVRVDSDAVMKDARRCQALLHSFVPMCVIHLLHPCSLIVTSR